MIPSPPAQVRPKALSVLLEASSLLLHESSEELLLSKTLDLAGSLLAADACAVWRVSEDDSTWLLVAQHGLSENYPKTLPRNGRPMPRAPWIVEDVATDERVEFQRAVLKQQGIRSIMIVPWRLDTAIDGAIAYYWLTPRRFTQDDEDYAVAFSNLAACALNRIELNDQKQRETRRLTFLAEASAMLASSLEYESTLQNVARLAVAQIAEWCTVHIAENGQLTRLVVAHADPAMAAFAEEYALRYPEQIEPSSGIGKVVRTGEPEIVSVVTPEMLDAAAQDDEHREILRQFRLTSSIVVPLLSRGKALGAIRLLGTNGRYFTSSDVQLALDLGRRAAVAIENAQLHRALLEQATELRQSHAAAKMGSWSWDLERDTIFWSPEFKALHGLPEDVVPTPEASYQLVHPEDRDRSKEEFWATVHSSATVFQSEHRALTPDGRVLCLQVRGRIRRDANGKADWIAGLIIDVTESRMAEQALRRAEKLAAAGRLAATVAHEVNNPLEALVNTVYLAQHTTGLPEEAAAHLQIAEGELQRIAHIVRQTLGFYRETTSPQSTDIRKLVCDVLDLYRSRSLSRGVTLRSSERSEDVFAAVIAGEIKQVLANLIANAIDATPPGGTVETSVQRLPDTVEIAIADTGSGISPANRQHLFEPFFTTKADVGTGLGLWVSKGIVEKHGGSIFVDDAAEQGTTFRVRLPLPTNGSPSEPKLSRGPA